MLPLTPRSPIICFLSQSARTESNRRRALIRSLLSPLSYGPLDARLLNEAGGIRTPTVQIKSLLCCRYTTTPCWSRVSVSNDAAWPCQSPMIHNRVAREGVEPSFPPYQSGVLNRWTTGLSDVLHFKQSPGDRNRTDNLVVPGHAGSQITPHPNVLNQNGRI